MTLMVQSQRHNISISKLLDNVSRYEVEFDRKNCGIALLGRGSHAQSSSVYLVGKVRHKMQAKTILLF